MSISRKITIIIAAVIVVFVGLLIYGYYHPQGKVLAPVSTPTTINCIQSPEYFVIDKNPGLPGLDIIAKHKTSPDQVMACADGEAAASDVVIQNDLPEQLLGLTEHFLIIDSGTAPPPRGLVIYDLSVGTSTYNDTYSSPITIATGTVTYWASTQTKPTTANCPDLGQYSADGLGAVVESNVTLNLQTLTKTSLGQSRCEPTQ